MITGAEAMVKSLEAEGITTVFGMPGAAICPFYDALYESKISHILMRHEQNAGHAANGYARLTGKPSVCVATSGPGALNLLTAIATAYMDSVPMVIITGQVSSDLLGRDVFQEADITGAAEPFVKHSYLLKSASDIARVFKNAFHISSTGRKGPVLIDVPQDIQQAGCDFCYPEISTIRSYKPNEQGHMGQIKRAVAAIQAAKRPIICAGGGVYGAEAAKELESFSVKAKMPIVTTMMGLGLGSRGKREYLGMIGMYGDALANKAMNEADLIMLIGARVGDRAIMSPLGLSENAVIVHIDIDPAEIGKNIKTDIPIVGDAKNILESLSTKLPKQERDYWCEYQERQGEEKSNQEHYISPRGVLRAVMAKAKSDAIIVADVGQNQIWAAQEYALEKGRFLASCGMGTMGYAVPCSIGAYLSSPNRQIVAVCGDGAFQMSIPELATIKATGAAVKIIVMNNSSLGLVKELQDREYNSHEIGVNQEGTPSLAAIAQAYGIAAMSIRQNSELEEAVGKLLQSDTAYLLECIVSPDETTMQ